MQGDRGDHDDNEFGIELQWPANSGGDDGAPIVSTSSSRRAVTPAYDAPATPPPPPPPVPAAPTAPPIDIPAPPVSENDQPMPLLPAMAGRIESVHGAIATLGVRIDALSAASNSFRSVLSDRLSDHVDAMSRMANSHAQDLEDYRQANDQVVAALRQASADSEATLRQLVERSDMIADELAGLTEAVGAARQPGAAGADGTDLGNQILDQVDDLVAANSGVMAELQGLLGRIETAAESSAAAPAAAGGETSAELLDALASIDDRLDGAERQQTAQLAELADGIAAIEERLSEANTATNVAGGDTAAAAELVEALRRAAGEVEAAGDELRDVRVTVQQIQEAAAASGGAVGLVAPGALPPGDLDDLREELQAELGALRDELTQLRRRISLRAKAPAVLEEDQITAIVDAVAARIELPDVPSTISLDSAALDELANRVTDRLAQSFEVVADEPAEAEPAPPARPPRANSGRLRADAPPARKATPPSSSRQRRTR